MRISFCIHVLHTPNQPTVINVKVFFFFILRGHGWFVSPWHSDASIHTPPNHVNTICDLQAKSLTTLSHRRPSSRLLYFTLHFSIAPVFLAHLSFSNPIFLSLCLFCCSATHSPSPLISLFQTHTCYKDIRIHVFCIFSQDGITHSTAFTSLTLGGHVSGLCMAVTVHLCAFVYTNVGVITVSAWEYKLQGWAFWWVSKEILGCGIKLLRHDVSVLVLKIFVERSMRQRAVTTERGKLRGFKVL